MTWGENPSDDVEMQPGVRCDVCGVPVRTSDEFLAIIPVMVATGGRCTTRPLVVDKDDDSLAVAMPIHTACLPQYVEGLLAEARSIGGRLTEESTP